MMIFIRMRPDDVLARDENFEESKHPRAPDGKFASGAGGGISISEMKKVGSQLGSNPGGTYLDKQSGKTFYVKKAKSPAHLENELRAAVLYKLAGAKTLDYTPVKDGPYIATAWQPLGKKNARHFSPEEKRAAQQDFAVHAWLANWDAVGLEHDNLGTTVENKPINLDLGGALEFRAMGQPKGSAFGSSVGEWDSLRNPKINSQSADVFGDMSQEQLRQSAERVTKIPNAKIREVAGPLADKLIQRKRDIAKRVGIQAADEGFDPSQHPHVPAGSPEGGQFAPKGGGGGGGGSAGAESSSTAAGKYIVNSHVGLVLKKHNYVKGPDEKGNMVFHGPNGHKIVIHPPEGGKKSSSKWTIYKPNADQITKTGIQLDSYLQKLHQQDIAAEKPTATPQQELNKLAIQHGFAAEPGGIFKHANGAMINVYPGGSWTAKMPGISTQHGNEPATLKDLLKKSFEHQVDKVKEEEAPKVADFLNKQGFKLTADSSIKVYSKASATVSYVTVGPKAGTWTSQSPGHVTKEGTGFEALEALLTTGKIMPGVKNVTPAPAPKPPPTPAAAGTYAHAQQAAIAPANGQQAQAVSAYKGSAYHHINECLRYKDPCTDPEAMQITDWLSKQSLPSDITVYRGIGGEVGKVLRSVLMVGAKFTERGFLSTSTSSNFSEGWGNSKNGGLFMKINAKAGAKGATIIQNYVDGEQEILFQRGSVMTVKSFDPKTRIVEVDLETPA